MASQNSHLVFIGTYTHKDSAGIYAARFDSDTGELSITGETGGIVNPSFLAIHPSGKYLYAVAEINDFEGNPSGGVTAYSVDAATGGLAELNSASSQGGGPCHLVVDGSGKYVLAANYGSGGLGVIALNDDGSLGEATQKIQHEGSSVNPRRQKGPHTHSINLDPNSDLAFAPELGIDKLLIYRLNTSTGQLIANDPPSVSVEPGAGPRHFDFHASGKYVFLLNEIGNTLTSYAYDSAGGVLTEIQTESTLPADWDGSSHTADVHVHPSGRFIYASNRGHDSLAIFEIDADTGRMTFVELESTRGNTPRNFAIDPTGKWILAANQDSDDIFVFALDESTGKLTYSGNSAKVSMPVCLKFYA